MGRSCSYCLLHPKQIPNKTPYELVHDKKPDLKFLHVFSALCYPTNDIEDLGKLKATTYIMIFVGYAHNKKGYRIYNKRTRRIMDTIHVQFDKLTVQMAPVHIEPPSVERPIPPASAVQVPVVSAGTPSSTTIDQDASSTSHSPSSLEVRPPILHQDVAARPTTEDNPFAYAEDNPFVNVFAPEHSSEESSSGDVSSAESTQVIQPHNHLGKWSKDHVSPKLNRSLQPAKGDSQLVNLLKFLEDVSKHFPSLSTTLSFQQHCNTSASKQLIGFVVFGKLPAINGFDVPLPVAICSGIVNSLFKKHGD
ncbi:retrovirus-related pol polyprotein from transposon TNT 1-94 [Tanacetum coccineum]